MLVLVFDKNLVFATARSADALLANLPSVRSKSATFPDDT